MVYTADRATGLFIAEFDTVEAAQAAIEQYEAGDKEMGIYEPNYYDIVDANHRSIIH